MIALKRTITPALAVVLSLLMMIYIFPADVAIAYANENEPELESQGVEQTEEKAVDALFELTDLRTADTKYIKMSDGTVKALVYDNAVHRMDESGIWQDIDNSLTESNNTIDSARVKFAKQITGDGELFTLHDGNRKISLSLVDAIKKTPITVVNDGTTDEKYATKLEELSTLSKVISSVRYNSILPNTDVEYILKGNDLKENIIINSVSEGYTYTFELSLNNLTAVLSEDGSIVLSDGEENVYVMPAPYMYDAAGNFSDAVYYTLAQANGSGKYTLTVTADSEWINDEGRAFPVTVDPTITWGSYTASIEDTYIVLYSSYVHYGEAKLFCGVKSNGYKYRSYIKINSFPYIPDDLPILSVSLTVNSTVTTTTGKQFSVYEVLNDLDLTTLNYYNLPSNLQEVFLSTTEFTTDLIHNFQIYTPTLENDLHNNTFSGSHIYMIKHTDESTDPENRDYNAFYSHTSSENSSCLPRLTVVYGYGLPGKLKESTVFHATSYTIADNSTDCCASYKLSGTQLTQVPPNNSVNTDIYDTMAIEHNGDAVSLVYYRTFTKIGVVRAENAPPVSGSSIVYEGASVPQGSIIDTRLLLLPVNEKEIVIVLKDYPEYCISRQNNSVVVSKIVNSVPSGDQLWKIYTIAPTEYMASLLMYSNTVDFDNEVCYINSRFTGTFLRYNDSANIIDMVADTSDNLGDAEIKIITISNHTSVFVLNGNQNVCLGLDENTKKIVPVSINDGYYPTNCCWSIEEENSGLYIIKNRSFDAVIKQPSGEEEECRLWINSQIQTPVVFNIEPDGAKIDIVNSTSWSIIKKESYDLRELSENATFSISTDSTDPNYDLYEGRIIPVSITHNDSTAYLSDSCYFNIVPSNSQDIGKFSYTSNGLLMKCYPSTGTIYVNVIHKPSNRVVMSNVALTVKSNNSPIACVFAIGEAFDMLASASQIQAQFDSVISTFNSKLSGTNGMLVCAQSPAFGIVFPANTHQHLFETEFSYYIQHAEYLYIEAHGALVNNTAKMLLSDGEEFIPESLSNNSLNNLKLAYFSCCKLGSVLGNDQTSFVERIIGKGAKNVIGYKTEVRNSSKNIWEKNFFDYLRNYSNWTPAIITNALSSSMGNSLNKVTFLYQ